MAVVTDVSVILCTYNRSESLRRTLASLSTVKPDPELSWELLLLDNNSRDSTPDVCRTYASMLPLRYIVERRQGKSFALNTGLDEARGRLLVFTDDDVDVEPEWLQGYWSAAGRYPEATYFTGRTYAKWESPPPRWLVEHANGLLSCISLQNDGGDSARLLRTWEVPVRGCNMAVRRSVFDDGTRFDVSLGPRGSSEERGEETALIQSLIGRGGIGVYVPSAVAHHRNGTERMSEAYVRKWFKAAGRVEARHGRPPASRYILGAPGHCWREAIVQAMRYVLTRWTCSSRVWLEAEMAMSRNWGRVCEFRSRLR